MALRDFLNSRSDHTKLIMGMVASEAVGNTLGPFLPVPFWNAFPKLHDRLVQTVSTKWILPNIDEVQPAMEDMFRSPKKAEQWEAAKAKGIQGRSDYLANEAVNLLSTYPFSFGTAFTTKILADKALGIKGNRLAFIGGSMAEGAIHLGGMVLLPKLLPEQMASLKSFTSKALMKMGMNEHDADATAMNIVYSGVPDLAGFAVNLGIQLVSHRR